MPALPTHVIYVALMGVAGLAVGVANAAFPDAAVWQLPPLLWLLGVSLLFDILVNQAAAAGRAAPLDMKWRVIGFLAGGLVSVLIPWRFGAA